MVSVVYKVALLWRGSGEGVKEGVGVVVRKGEKGGWVVGLDE